MGCNAPREAYRDRVSGHVWYGSHPGRDGDRLELPCWQCYGCRQARAREWAIRIGHEAQLFDSNLFVTLTYDDEHLPASRSLEYSDFQLFMRRLRRQLGGAGVGPEGGRPLRFFVAGEYGSLTKRPHWHVILFNVLFPDQRKLESGKFSSLFLERLWPLGKVDIGSVTPASAAYVAGYVNGKVYGRAGRERLEDVVNLRTGELSSRRPEFCRMSLKPGIGTWWFRRFGRDLFPGDFAVQDGQKYRVPRFYWEKFKKEADPSLVEELQYGRYLRAMEKREESTPERRAVREEVQERKVLFKLRGN